MMPEPDVIQTPSERFLALFDGHHDNYLRFNPESLLPSNEKGKRVPSYIIQHEPLTTEVVARHLNGALSIGCAPNRNDDTAGFGAMDLDQYKDTKHEWYAKIFAQNEIPIICAKSKSGGLHGYVFCSPGVPASLLIQWFRQLLAQLNLAASTEVFPRFAKRKDGNGNDNDGGAINWPYFDYAATERYALGPSGEPLSFKEFLDLAEASRRGADYFAIPPVLSKLDDTDRKDAPSNGHQKDVHVHNPEARYNRIKFKMRAFMARTPDLSEEALRAQVMHLVRTIKPPFTEQEITAKKGEHARLAKWGMDLLHKLPKLKNLEDFDSSDEGNGHRFVDRFSGEVRYCAENKSFYIYDEHRWARETWSQGGAFISILAEQMKARAEALPRENPGWEALLKSKRKTDELLKTSEFYQWAGLLKQRQRLCSAAGHNDCMSKLKSQPEIQISLDALDRDRFLLNCQNCTVDLRTGEARPQIMEDWISRMADVEYNPDAQSDIWDKFLDTILPKDPELRRYLQKAFGMSLTGDTSAKAFFFLWGVPDTAKSTLIAAFGRMMGSYALSMDFSTIIQKPPTSGNAPRSDIARLEGIRFAYASEVGKGEKFDEKTLKRWTGNVDEMVARDLHQSDRSWRPQGKIWLAANDRPEIPEADEALWNRLHCIHFTKQFKAGSPERDEHMFEKLNAPEVRSAMLAWAVKGCLMWQRDGHLLKPKYVTDTTANYRQEMDPLAQFFNECCVFGQDEHVGKHELHQYYTTWDQSGPRNKLRNYLPFCHQVKKNAEARGIWDKRIPKLRTKCGGAV